MKLIYIPLLDSPKKEGDGQAGTQDGWPFESILQHVQVPFTDLANFQQRGSAQKVGLQSVRAAG